MQRRHFLKTSLAATAFASNVSTRAATPGKKILLRSSWQTVNIGDIAHTPGMLSLLEKHLPEYEITLWPSHVDNGVDELLMTRFPKLKIMGKTAAAKEEAFEACDFLLHGSGPGIVGQKSIIEWTEETGKPYGIGGVTWSYSEAGLKVISDAEFTFFRDSVSLQLARDKGATCPIMEFGPDATFACDLTNDEAAAAWLGEVGLEEGNFMCCIPKLRNTPYWEVKKGYSFDGEKHARNEEMKEHDIAPLRQAVIAIVKETDMKVLLCPEDATQMKLNKEMIYDKLPEEVKGRVVWREDYWLTDFATSVYTRCAGLFGNEQHSPILCIGHGIPAIVCRYKEQTSKGFMWKDIGLSDWLFDHDLDEAEKGLTPAVLSIATDQNAARAKALEGKAVADDRMKRMMDVLRETVDSA
ncbi:MAG: polysaccharide pyruvyl transferase family protein [Verrucomicrobiales bacterium]|nr:polysaccharide pyruvyl transferase family protein [Verrucomicrobiales bacterium]